MKNLKCNLNVDDETVQKLYEKKKELKFRTLKTKGGKEIQLKK